MINEWLWVAWNLKGAPDYYQWLLYDEYERRMMKAGLTSLIEKHNDQFDE